MLDRILEDLPAHQPRPASAPKLLEGIRIIDFTHFIAGPYGTMMLGDMGADVIKIEAPGRGDDFRHYPPAHPQMEAHSAPYVWCNRNKRSVALDLKTDAGMQLVRELIAQADVVVENFSTGVMARFGLDYESCNRLRPEIVYCSVSAYGREGEFADRLGFDPIAQAESGFISMNGYPDREGVRTLSPIVDVSTGTMVCNGILGALLSRERSGKGQALEIALFDTAIQMTGFASMQYLYNGVDHTRQGNTSPDSSPSGVFKCKDRSFYINCGNDKIFHRLMTKVIGRPDIAADPVLCTRKGRIARRAELFAVLEEAFLAQPWSYWQPLMRASSVPCGELRTVGEALRSREATSRHIVSRISHPKVGWIPNIASPIRYASTPMADPVYAPAIGEHNAAVLHDVLGYDDARIGELQSQGAFGN